MVPLTRIKNSALIFAALVLASYILAACASPKQRYATSTTQEKEPDIYAALTNNEIQYRDETAQPDGYSNPNSSSNGSSGNNGNPEFIAQSLNEVRNNFFRKDYDTALATAERLIRLDPNSAESYYWLARIYMEKAEYQQAHAMAAKGLTVASNANLTRELDRIRRQAQMGAN